MADAIDVSVQSGYGARDRRPLVDLAVHGPRSHATVQVNPSVALRIARQLISAASAALGDAAVVEMLGGESLTTDEIASVLTRLRTAREAVDQREGTEDE